MSDPNPLEAETGVGPTEGQLGRRDLSILLDNPIIIKQSRVRLKRSSILTWLVFVGLICSLLIWMEFEITGSQRFDRAAGYIFGGMIFMMLIIGTQALSMVVNATRASGMIDFHRLSPQSPLSLFLGFFLGGPIREYVVAAFASLFMILALVLYGTPVWGVLLLLALFSIWVANLYGLAIVSVMLARNPNPNAPKGAAWGIFAGVSMLGPILSSTMSVNRLASEPGMLQFWGIEFNAILLFSLFGLVPMAFLLIAGINRLRDDNGPSLSKKQSTLAFGFSIFFGLGLIFKPNYPNVSNMQISLELSTLALWVLSGMILIATATPERVAYVNGLRRSLRLGLRRPGLLDNCSLNRFTLAAYGVILSAGLFFSNLFRNESFSSEKSLQSASAATAILFLVQFGLALQYFRLRLGRNANGAMIGWAIIAWILPFAMGIAVNLTGSGQDVENIGLLIMSISPVPGVVLGSGALTMVDDQMRNCQLASLFPALTAVFIFNMMITNLQRRIDKRILPDHQAQSTDPFAYLEHASARDLVAGDLRKSKPRPNSEIQS